ncbi:MAG TPA: diacylglycerol kinase family protein [Gemmatimonadales bacterium]|nr:diacylglycerol kinase family protein [Gemmatimonadales bacterium]
MTTLLLVNPAAGHGRARRVAAEVKAAVQEAWGRVDALESAAPGHAVDLARQAAEVGVARILVVGGDGTVHEAVNGVLQARGDARPPVAVIPAGTGNDFAKLIRTLGHRPVDAVRRLARGLVRRLDVGHAWGEYFVNSIGIGFDAEVARLVNQSTRGRGLAVYLWAVARVIRRYRAFEAQVTADDRTFTDRLLLLEIGNGPVVGGGFRLTPFAVPDDGILDVCAIRHLSAAGILAKLPLAMLGRHTGLRQVRSFRATRVEVRSGEGILQAQLDGELRARSDRVEVRIAPAALPVIVAV